MTITYNKILAFILLASALLGQTYIQASEQASDTTTTYCPSLKCWQKTPCLEHKLSKTGEALQILYSLQKRAKVGAIKENPWENGFSVWTASITFPSKATYKKSKHLLLGLPYMLPDKPGSSPYTIVATICAGSRSEEQKKD